jgi:hypothetical protein
MLKWASTMNCNINNKITVLLLNLPSNGHSCRVATICVGDYVAGIIQPLSFSVRIVLGELSFTTIVEELLQQRAWCQHCGYKRGWWYCNCTFEHGILSLRMV